MHPARCPSSLLAGFVMVMLQSAASVIIQAEIDIDDDSEHLIRSLIGKVDTIIDPHKVDSDNATKEIAYALLKIGPSITVRGTIGDRSNSFSLSFILSAKAEINKTMEFNVVTVRQEHDGVDGEESSFEEFVTSLEWYMSSVLSIIGHAIITNVVSNLMTDLALHSDTNLIS